MFLAVVGLYGLLAYAVRQRTCEIGVRMALGAARGDVIRMVLRQGLALTASGLAIGLIGAGLAALWGAALLYGIHAFDPVTFVILPVLMMLAASIACLLPAWKAARAWILSPACATNNQASDTIVPIALRRMKLGPILALCIGSSLALAQTAPAENGFVLKGGTVHTISGGVIENGSVLVRNGKIVGVGKNLTAPKDFKVIEITGQHVYPGMIDPASMIGLEKASEELASDAQEIGLINPQLRAATAVNPDSESIEMTRANGITSAIVMPQGDLIAGQMSLIHLDGSSNNDMLVSRTASIFLRFPAITTVPLRPHEDLNDDEEPHTDDTPEPIPHEQAVKTYQERLQTLRTFFDEARLYKRAKQSKSRDFKPNLKFEALLPVLDGTTPMFVEAVREREIREAIAFADEQKIKIILADAYEAYKVLPLIKSHNIPVVLGPTFTYPLDRDEAYDRNYTIPADLYKAGIKFAIGTFSAMSSRNLPFQAAAAVPYGLPEDAAYKAVSLNAAEIFGLGKKLGSIDEGKSADLIVTDGDPLDVRTTVKMVFIDGKPADLETKQKMLYEKYKTQK